MRLGRKLARGVVETAREFEPTPAPQPRQSGDPDRSDAAPPVASSLREQPEPAVHSTVR